ncbi:hypothetical protein ACLOJK_007203 [Asimina triloba]
MSVFIGAGEDADLVGFDADDSERSCLSRFYRVPTGFGENDDGQWKMDLPELEKQATGRWTFGAASPSSVSKQQNEACGWSRSSDGRPPVVDREPATMDTHSEKKTSSISMLRAFFDDFDDSGITMVAEQASKLHS